MIRDVLKNWWVILFIAISVSLLTYIAAAWMYHPTYTSSTTFVVSAKGSSTGAYANKSQTEKLDTTVFGTLNHEASYRNLKARLKRQKKKILITEPAVSFGFVETIKKMRTKLLYYRSKNQDKVLLVTSTMKKEGKTIVAANLALAMAQRGKKVLLIEGDMRKSSLAAFLNVDVPEGTGFSERIGNNLESLIFKMPDKS